MFAIAFLCYCCNFQYLVRVGMSDFGETCVCVCYYGGGGICIEGLLLTVAVS